MPIAFSGVPCWVWTCTVPGRFTMVRGKLTLFTKYLAVAIVLRYAGVLTITYGTPSGSVAAWARFSTTQTPWIPGASSFAFS